MKKTLQSLFCMLIVLALTACSENAKLKGLLEQIPAESDVVMVGNVKTVLESMGGSLENNKIKLPANVEDLFSEGEIKELENFNDLLKNSGIDPEAAGGMVDYSMDIPILVVALEDAEKFTRMLDKEGYREKDSESKVKYYAKYLYPDMDESPKSFVAVNGDVAYYIERISPYKEINGVTYLQRIIDNATERNVAETKYGDYLIDGNIGGTAITLPRELRKQMRGQGIPEEILSLYQSTVVVRGNLTETQCALSCKIFDENGEEVNTEKFKKFVDLSEPINKEALKLIGKDEIMIAAANIKSINWDNYFDLLTSMPGLSRSARAEMRATLSFFRNIEGTVAIGIGVTEGKESLYQVSINKKGFSSKHMPMTVVIETKANKSKQLLSDLKNMAEKAGIPFEDGANKFTITLPTNPDESTTIEVSTHGNFLVIANHKVQSTDENPTLNENDLTEYNSAFILNLDKNSRLGKDLEMTNSLTMLAYTKPNSLEGTMLIEVSDGDNNSKQGVLANLIQTFSKMAKSMETLQERRWEDINAAEDVWNTDSLAPDTAI